MNFVKGERIKDANIEGQTLVIGSENPDAYMALIRCDVKNCHVIVDSDPRDAPFHESVFDNCLIEYKRQLKNARFFTNAFHRCRFKGKFHGVDFGREHGLHPVTNRPDELGAVIECDFTQAKLDWCRFFEVDIYAQKFAPWPQFVVPHDKEQEAFQRNDVWPGEFARFVSLSQHQAPNISGSPCMAATIQKTYKITEVELLQALDAIGGVIK